MSPRETAPHVLKRELGLADLVSLQVLLVIGTTWPADAARLGPAQITVWLAAVAVFFIPLGMVVDFCASTWPQEGGTYQWTKQAMGPFAGFIAAWNFGAYAVLLISATGVLAAAALAYTFGPEASWMANSAWLIGTINAVSLGFMLVANIRGLGTGKWIGHVGTICVAVSFLLCFTLLLFHPDAGPGHPHLAPQPVAALGLPVITLASANLFTKLTFNGLSGLEQVAVFAGETRNARSSIRRSVWIAAPLIALIYVLTTSVLLDYTPAADVDLTAPIPQLLSRAFGAAHAPALRHGGLILVAFVNLAGLMATIGQFAVTMAETSRLPMVAAWDNLLPAAFTRLHPRFGTPVLALCVVAGGAMGFALIASAGAGGAEAFQVIVGSSFLCEGFYYLLLFAVPLVVSPRPGMAVRLAGVCGASLTLAAMAFQLIPVISVASAGTFTLKVAATAAAINGVGAVIYWRARH